jgi:antitoxin CptB
VPGDACTLGRLRIRSWRRGIREVDLLLGPYADAALPALSREELKAYERLLSENDHDVYWWIGGRADTPAAHAATIRRIRAFHGMD